MDDDIIYKIKICLKNRNNRVISICKNIPKETNLAKLRKIINSKTIISGDFLFLDNGEPINAELEEDFIIEDIIDNQCKIYIQENFSPKLNEKDIIENIKESKERKEEAKVTKNEKKIYDIFHENKNKKEIRKKEPENVITKKEKFDEENKMIEKKENNKEENKNDIENEKNKELEEKIKILEEQLRIEKSINNNLKEKIKILEKGNNIGNMDYILKLINSLLLKEEEIKEMKSRYPFEILKGEKIISLIFMSNNQEIHYSLVCKDSDIFSHVENLLYDIFPKYRETENYFVFEGHKINKYKTLKENNLKNGSIIMLNQIDEE